MFKVTIVNTIGIALLIVGALFKILHWEGALPLLIIGPILIISSEIYTLLKNINRSFQNYTHTIFISLFFSYFVAHFLHYQYAYGFLILGAIVYIINLIYSSFLKKNQPEEGGEKSNEKIGFMAIIQFVYTFLIIIGALFKIMHWPGANILLISGLVISFIYYLLMFVKND